MFILKSRFFGRCAGLINEQRYTILSEYFKYVLDFNFLQYMHVFRWADSKNVIIVIIFNELDPLYDCKGVLTRWSNLPYQYLTPCAKIVCIRIYVSSSTDISTMPYTVNIVVWFPSIPGHQWCHTKTKELWEIVQL